jgi:hypothetical protein
LHWTYFVLIIIGMGLFGGLTAEGLGMYKGRSRHGRKSHAILKAEIIAELKKDNSPLLLPGSKEYEERLSAQEADIVRLSDEIEFLKKLLESKASSD